METPGSFVLLTEREFHSEFIPLTFDETDVIVPLEWPDKRLDEAAEQNRIWTVVLRNDLRPSLINGHHPENRLYSVVTEVRYATGDRIVVEIDDGWA